MKTTLFATVFVGTAMGNFCQAIQDQIESSHSYALTLNSTQLLAVKDQYKKTCESSQMFGCTWTESGSTYTCSGTGVFDIGSSPEFMCLNDKMTPMCTACETVLGPCGDDASAIEMLETVFDDLNDTTFEKMCTSQGDVCLQSLAGFMGNALGCFDGFEMPTEDEDDEMPTEAEMTATFKLICAKNQQGQFCFPLGDRIGDANTTEDKCAAMANAGCCLGTFIEHARLVGGDDLDEADADLSECSMATPRACASPDEPEVEVVQFDGQVTINFALTSEPDLRSFLATQFATQLNVDPADLEISVDDASGNFTVWVTPNATTTAATVQAANVTLSSVAGVTASTAPVGITRTERFEGNSAEVKKTTSGATTAHAFGFAALLVATLV